MFVSLYPFIWCLLHVCHIHSYLVNIVHELLFSSLALTNWVPYLFPPNFTPRQSTTLTEFSLIVIVVMFNSPWFTHIFLLLCLHIFLLVNLVHFCQFGIFPLSSFSMSSFFCLWCHPLHWRLTGHFILDFFGIIIQFIMSIWWVAIFSLSNVFF